jgi:hypothetical protein
MMEVECIKCNNKKNALTVSRKDVARCCVRVMWAAFSLLNVDCVPVTTSLRCAGASLLFQSRKAKSARRGRCAGWLGTRCYFAVENTKPSQIVHTKLHSIFFIRVYGI